VLSPPLRPSVAVQEAFDHNWSSPAPQGKPFHIEVKGGAILPKSAGPEWAWLQQHLVKVEGALEVEMERMEQRLEEAELRIAAHEHALTESLEEGLTARKMLTGGSGGMSMGMSLGVRRGFGVKRFRGKVSKGTKCDSMSCEGSEDRTVPGAADTARRSPHRVPSASGSRRRPCR